MMGSIKEVFVDLQTLVVKTIKASLFNFTLRICPGELLIFSTYSEYEFYHSIYFHFLPFGSHENVNFTSDQFQLSRFTLILSNWCSVTVKIILWKFTKNIINFTLDVEYIMKSYESNNFAIKKVKNGIWNHWK